MVCILGMPLRRDPEITISPLNHRACRRDNRLPHGAYAARHAEERRSVLRGVACSCVRELRHRSRTLDIELRRQLVRCQGRFVGALRYFGEAEMSVRIRHGGQANSRSLALTTSCTAATADGRIFSQNWWK